MKILKMSDRIRLTVGELVFTLAPLSKNQKVEILQCTTTTDGGNPLINGMEYQCLYLKHGLKDIKGLKDHHGNEYKLSFDGDSLSDDCISELFYIQDQIDPVLMFYNQNLHTFSDVLKDPTTGKKVKGVVLDILSMEQLKT